jgi:hypothetical protein
MSKFNTIKGKTPQWKRRRAAALALKLWARDSLSPSHTKKGPGRRPVLGLSSPRL